jgi:hypothetical protein
MADLIGIHRGTDGLKLNEADIAESHKRGPTALADQRKVLMAPRTPPAPASADAGRHQIFPGGATLILSPIT